MTAPRHLAWLAAGLACVALGVLGALGPFGCGSMTEAAPTMRQPPADCMTDHDCDVVPDCCGCNGAGRRFAIRRDAVPEYMVARQEHCGNVQCPLAMSIDSSCNAELHCGSYGACRLVPLTRNM
jgi:hypothetical protein